MNGALLVSKEKIIQRLYLYFTAIGLFVVFDTILTRRQTRLEITVLCGNPMSNNFHYLNIASEKLMNWKLLALGKRFFCYVVS